MPVRFRRTFNILPGVKVNVSKGGISFTVGTRGYHLNFSKRGVKQTVGLPGSGISQSSYIIKNDSDPEEKASESDKDERGTNRRSAKKNNDEQDKVEVEERVVTQRRRTPAWILLLGIVVVYLGALVLNLIPTNFLSQLLDTLTEWTRGMGL